jgi:hypothetical protein
LIRTAPPRAERQLILLSAGTAGRRRALRELAGRLAAGVQWARLAETLHARKLLPTLGPRILELAQGRANAEFAAAVEQATATARRHGVLLQLATERMMSTLAVAGIRSSALKGPLLSEAIYGDPGRRLSRDIDLLVAPEQLGAAVGVVCGMGYDAPTDHVLESGLPLLHFALAHVHGELPPVELHWRVHWYERSFAVDRLLPPVGTPVKGWRPAPVDELVALLLFYARDGFIELRLAADLSAWWDARGAELEPGALEELLGVHPALAPAVAAAARVAEQVVGLPAAQLIRETPKPGLRGRAAMRLANPNPHAGQAQLNADMGLIDGLLAPSGDFGAFLRRQVLLPPEVLDKQADSASRRRLKALLGHNGLQLARLGIVGRYGLALARTVRAPETLHLALE